MAPPSVVPADCCRGPYAVQGHLQPAAAAGAQRLGPAGHRPVKGAAAWRAFGWRGCDAWARGRTALWAQHRQPAACCHGRVLRTAGLPAVLSRPAGVRPAPPPRVSYRSALSWRPRRKAQTSWCLKAWGVRLRPTCMRGSGECRCGVCMECQQDGAKAAARQAAKPPVLLPGRSAACASPVPSSRSCALPPPPPFCSCDQLNIGMIKHPEVAAALGGRLYDCVCQFRPAAGGGTADGVQG